MKYVSEELEANLKKSQKLLSGKSNRIGGKYIEEASQAFNHTRINNLTAYPAESKSTIEIKVSKLKVPEIKERLKQNNISFESWELKESLRQKLITCLMKAESLQRDLTAALQDGIEDVIAEQESAEQFSDNNSDTEHA